MGDTDTIPSSATLDTLKDAIKDAPTEPITLNGDQSHIVDGAHTNDHAHTNGIITANGVTQVEPVVIIAEPQPVDTTETLIHKTTSSDNIDNNASSTPNQSSTHETAKPAVIDHEKKHNGDVVKEEIKEEKHQEANTAKEELESKELKIEEIQPIVEIDAQHPEPHNTTTSSPSTSNVASDSARSATSPMTHSRNNSNNNNNIGGGNPELRTSTRNLRSSVIGIDEEELDEHSIKLKKMRRKERSHSRIVLYHKKNVIGETIFKGHQSWVLMLNIQTGIRNAVGRGHSRSTITAPKSPIVDPSSASAPKSPIEVMGPNNFDKIEEFYASPKVLNFPPEGSANTIPHNTGPFKFKDYSPHAFRFLRHRFGIDTADYMVSLCNTQKNGENALRELPTPGKSGSLFFFSHDMRFIIKTIPKSEAKLLRSLLPSYVDHIANDENTLLPKFFGLHRVKPHRGRQVRFLVMSNIFQTRKTIHERYDLKGSTLGRAASEEEKKKDTVTYKDLDFREKNMKIQIGPEKRSALLDQLQRDVKFLAKLNIMDYSLLIGTHNTEKEDEYTSAPPSPQSSHASMPKVNHDLSNEYFHSIFQENDGGLRGLDEHGVSNGKIYYIGIIDILMLYSIRKKIEHTYKTLRYGDEQAISSIQPSDYAIRFYDFMANSIT